MADEYKPDVKKCEEELKKASYAFFSGGFDDPDALALFEEKIGVLLHDHIATCDAIMVIDSVMDLERVDEKKAAEFIAYIAANAPHDTKLYQDARSYWGERVDPLFNDYDTLVAEIEEKMGNGEVIDFHNPGAAFWRFIRNHQMKTEGEIDFICGIIDATADINLEGGVTASYYAAEFAALGTPMHEKALKMYAALSDRLIAFEPDKAFDVFSRAVMGISVSDNRTPRDVVDATIEKLLVAAANKKDLPPREAAPLMLSAALKASPDSELQQKAAAAWSDAVVKEGQDPVVTSVIVDHYRSAFRMNLSDCMQKAVAETTDKLKQKKSPKAKPPQLKI